MHVPAPLHSFWARGQTRPLLCGIVRRAGHPAGHQQAIKSACTRAGKKRHIDRRRSSIHLYRCSRCPSPNPKGRRLPSESSSAPTEGPRTPTRDVLNSTIPETLTSPTDATGLESCSRPTPRLPRDPQASLTAHHVPAWKQDRLPRGFTRPLDPVGRC